MKQDVYFKDPATQNVDTRSFDYAFDSQDETQDKYASAQAFLEAYEDILQNISFDKLSDEARSTKFRDLRTPKSTLSWLCHTQLVPKNMTQMAETTGCHQVTQERKIMEKLKKIIATHIETIRPPHIVRSVLVLQAYIESPTVIIAVRPILKQTIWGS